MRRNRSKMIRTLIFLIFIVLIIAPILIMINTSLQSYENIRVWPPKWFQEFKWENYYEVIFGEKAITTAFFNTLQISIITSIICVIVGALAAYAVTRYEFIGKRTFLILIIVTQMFSPVILVNPMYIIFKNLGLLNTKLSLIIANTATSLPMTIWLLYSYFSQIPIEYEEALWMDGASRLRGVFDVVIPIAAPGMVTAGLYSFIKAWGDIVFAKSFILSSELRTISAALNDFQELYKTTWETQMAASIITTIPPFILFMFIQKQLIRGTVQDGLD